MSNKSSVKIIQEYRQLKYLPQSVVLEESGSPRLILLTIMAITLVVIAFITWAAIIQVDEVATAMGEIVPANKIQVIQHLEGGIVSDILVENGQSIKKGQVLARIEPTGALSELDKNKSHELALLLDINRLHAFVQRKPLKYDDLVEKLKPADIKISSADLKNMILDTISLYRLQNTSRVNEQEILQTQMEQRKKEFEKILDKKKHINNHIKLLQEEEKIYAELRKSESISRVKLLELSRQLNEAQGNLSDVTSDQHRAKQAILEIEQRISARQFELNHNALQEISDKDAEVLATRMTQKRLLDRVKRLDVLAPVNGIVKGLDVSIGSVLQPGGEIMEIVPLGKDMLVQARLSTQDIGHIAIGDRVNVKITTYDFVRYGKINGVVDNISASTFIDEDGAPYYKIIIRLEKNHVGEHVGRNSIIPGMVVVADIVTGEKSLLSYLLKPIHRSLQDAFHER